MDWIVYHKNTPDFQEADGGFVTMTDFTKVADVRFVTASDGDRSTLFRITNSVDEYWVEEFCNEKYHESFVMTVEAGIRGRSTSVGDLFLCVTAGIYYEVAGCGWNEVTLAK